MLKFMLHYLQTGYVLVFVMHKSLGGANNTEQQSEGAACE